MKTDLVAATQAFVLLVIGHLLQLVDVAGDDYQNNYQNNYQYYNNHGDQGPEHYYETYENPNNNPPPQDYTYDLPSTIACFSCTLVKHDGHMQGMTNCDDPFVRLDIPSVDCKGPCGKLYHQHGEKDFVITRGCIPNCKEHRDDKSYTQCCTKAYCNTASSISHFSHKVALCSATLVTLWLLQR